MQVSVTFRHMDPTDALKEYAEDKIARLQKYVDWPVEVHVVLSTEKFEHVAEVTATTRGSAFKGSERAEDMYASIDGAVEKVERQVVKYKERVKSH